MKEKKSLDNFGLIYESQKIKPTSMADIKGGYYAAEKCITITVGTNGWPFLKCNDTYIGID
jgi:hypothetical protein